MYDITCSDILVIVRGHKLYVCMYVCMYVCVHVHVGIWYAHCMSGIDGTRTLTGGVVEALWRQSSRACTGSCTSPLFWSRLVT